ncbi:MAG: saccharopine dehydrogenase NADP-binding domain-containing protein [Gammaproteobacteria bacterium]|nr:saccharopine dehydrogenase NADP-binding domain-containing protein [Gammaproteobacteria bacterium]
MSLVIYGAYGYTGKLIVAEAVRQGMKPMLAGRNADKLRALAEQFDLPWQACDIDDTDGLQKLLLPADAVLHCAGPFHRTVDAMLGACLATKTHYLDITGEIAVFERLAAANGEAQRAGITLLPGVGFDVVPTDCLAAHLKEKLPDASDLKLAFMGGGGMSRGTLLTMIDGLGEPGAMRENGRIVPVPPAFDVIDVDFGSESGRPSWSCMSIPWGDVSTAFHSTGIPNILTYTAVPPSSIRKLKRSRWFGWLLRREFIRNLARKRIKAGKSGPSDDTRAGSQTFVWGEARNAGGQVASARLVGDNGYSLTATAAVESARRMLTGTVSAGFQTPSRAFGADYILELGAKREDLD